jgi:hypothetical protein
MTTSVSGQIKLNIHLRQQGFNSGFWWSIYSGQIGAGSLVFPHNEQTSKIGSMNILDNFRLNNEKKDFQSDLRENFLRKLQ